MDHFPSAEFHAFVDHVFSFISESPDNFSSLEVLDFGFVESLHFRDHLLMRFQQARSCGCLKNLVRLIVNELDMI